MLHKPKLPGQLKKQQSIFNPVIFTGTVKKLIFLGSWKMWKMSLSKAYSSHQQPKKNGAGAYIVEVASQKKIGLFSGQCQSITEAESRGLPFHQIIL
jgi:hypothetical protein